MGPERGGTGGYNDNGSEAVGVVAVNNVSVCVRHMVDDSVR